MKNVKTTPIDEARTLVELLRTRVQEQPTAKLYTYLMDGDTEGAVLEYAVLERQARAIAATLQTTMKQGDRALLFYPSGPEFISAFFGCLFAGVIGVPLQVHGFAHLKKTLPATYEIAQAAATSVILTTSSLVSKIREASETLPGIGNLRIIPTNSIEIGLFNEWREPQLVGDTVAYLQFTSGSTSAPKGVIISHRNLLENVACFDHNWGHPPGSSIVTWMPHFHDLGLIYGLLQPLYNGIPAYILSPVSFIQKPVRWLGAISRYHGTHSMGPNFAYDLCVRKVTDEQCASLDLSSWQIAMNAAEPVRKQAIEGFIERFSLAGFRRAAFSVAYGLAESTCKITATPKSSEIAILAVKPDALEQGKIREIQSADEKAREFACCGVPMPGTKIAIVDPNTCVSCESGRVGEIWTAGPCVAQGYWDRPEETRETFEARIKSTNEGPFLRTGDLGFLKNGQLFITGRKKDLIIIRGENHYPQDIEWTVDKCHEALTPGCCAVFSVDDGNEERLVVVQEVKRNFKQDDAGEVFRTIIRVVAEQHDLQVWAIQLLRPASIHKTTSGKIQRSSCKKAFLEDGLQAVAEWRAAVPAVAASAGRENETDSRQAAFREPGKKEKIQAWLVSKVAERTGIQPSMLDVHEPISYYGLDSAGMVSLSGELEDWLGRNLSATLVYDYPTIDALARYLGENPGFCSGTAGVPDKKNVETEQIAIIGLGCRFPGAENPEAFWQLLRDGVGAVTDIPASRWNLDDFYAAQPQTPGKMYTRRGGFLEQVDRFDPQFFGISPREAASMDPQQRLLLEVTWEALENAGLAPDRLAGSQTGVFIGISNSDYGRLPSGHAPDLTFYAGTGTAYSIAANRLSYFLDLRGPSWAVDTACSSSLVAVHQACLSLRQGECDLALVGGVNLILSPEMNIVFSQAQMLAEDGRCKTFDAAADGYVRGEGCGVVVLKRYSDAVRDGDSILALIKGSAVNQDGRSNGLTAPNGPAQRAVIRRALQNAGVSPSQISYVEAHGAATLLGDPIELNSLKEVLMHERLPEQRCWIGSVKTNIGHLEASAGIAGLIKVVLSLQQGEIPAHLHLNTLNPHILLDGSSLSIPISLQKWPDENKGRLAGLSSFGFGGTNAHIILEEAPSPTPAATKSDRPCHVLTLSAKSEAALQELARRYRIYLKAHHDLPLGDICFTANVGRSHFQHRLAVVCDSADRLDEKLAVFSDGGEAAGLISGHVPSGKLPKVAFLFTGAGSQYVNMGRQLYDTQPVFRTALDRCNDILKSYFGKNLLDVLYAPLDAFSDLDQTFYAHPALFSIQFALSELWKSWGIQPSAVLGHSVGEYAAACIAGVFTLEDGLKLTAERARLIQSLTVTGEMVAVLTDEAEVAAAIRPYAKEISIAGINGPENIVISGTSTAIQAVLSVLETAGRKTIKLNVTHALHSPATEPMMAAFEKVARSVSYAAPRISIVSTVTGKIAEAGMSAPEYWLRHLRQPVRFSEGLRTLHQQGCEVFVEIGPKPDLLGMAQQCLPPGSGVWLPSLRPGRSDPQQVPFFMAGLEKLSPQLWAGKTDWEQMLESLGELYAQGMHIDWHGVERDYARRRVALPTYPFQRQRYWLETEGNGNQKAQASTQDKIWTPLFDLLHRGDVEQAVQILEKKERFSEETKKALPDILKALVNRHQQDAAAVAVKDWRYELQWQHKPRRQESVPKNIFFSSPGYWMIFADREGVGETLAGHLREQGQSCILVYPDEKYRNEKPGVWSVNPSVRADFERLFQEGLKDNPANMNIRGVVHLWSLDAASADKLTLASLEHAQVLGCASVLHLMQAMAGHSDSITPRLWFVTRGAVSAETDSRPPSVAQAPVWGFGKVIALEHPEMWGGMVDFPPESSLDEAAALFAEIGNSQGEDHIAFRSDKRYVARLVRAGELQPQEAPIRSDASYLITGGLGGLGLKIARWMVDQGARHLVLIGRRGASGKTLEEVRRLEQAGAVVLVATADVSNESEMAGLFERIRQSCPPLRGIIHTAGILDDGFVLRQDWKRFIKVMAPKVSGAWNLHVMTQNLEMDFFVLFSSVASLLGSVGQGNYAAGNAFLDALARYRRAAGLAGLSINWGPWSEVGMSAGLSSSDQARITTMGLNMIPPECGLRVVQEMLGQTKSQVGVLSIDWRAFQEGFPQGKQMPLLSALLPREETRETAAEQRQQSDILQRMNDASTDDRRNLLIDYIQGEVARVLGLAADRLPDPKNGFFEMGMDSLMAVNLKNRLESAVGSSLSSTIVFKYATIEKLADYLSRNLLNLEPARRAGQASPISPGKPLSFDGVLPLSLAQQRLWLLVQLDPNSPWYNIPIAVRLRGTLNISTLEQSFNEIVRRHQAIRTRFVAKEGGPVQIVDRESRLSIAITDISGLPESEREREGLRIAGEEAQRPFDLATAPLIRVSVLRLGEEDHVLLVTMHHIVSDGWSMGVLIRELTTLYEAFSYGHLSPLPELPIQFADFAAWQREWLQGDVLEDVFSYWKRGLSGELPILQLPTDRPRPAVQTYRGARHSFILPSKLSAEIREFSGREDVTLFMTLLTAFQTLLYRYSGQYDIIVGSPISNRNFSETQPLIGFFINILLLRADLSGNPGFRELMARVRETCLGAYAHQDVPYEQLLETLHPDRNPSRSLWYQVMFNMENALGSAFTIRSKMTSAIGSAFTAPGTVASTIKVDSGVTSFDLTLNMEDTEQGLVGALEYNTDLFNASTIEKFTQHFVVLLEHIVAEPDTRISSLQILTESERRQLLTEWNDTGRDYPGNVCIHELFEAQAEKTPEATAVVCGARHLTYQELNHRSNQLARYLQKHGVGPDVRVGICVEKSLEMIIGLLGVLKAGGAYVPLDPAYPKERLAFMLEDARIAVLLTQDGLKSGLPATTASVVCLDAEWETISSERGENAASGATAGNLVYVIYTSGSTGKPRGVMVLHRSLVNAYFGWEEAYQLRTACRNHLQMASFSFDVCAGDVVRALCSGGKLVLCPREKLLDPVQLYRLMIEQQVDCAEFVPAVLRSLTQYLDKTGGDLAFMRLLAVGSDSFYIKEHDEFKRFCGPGTRLINSYGLSEVTVDSTYFERTESELSPDGLVPIGRPFANTGLYILDRNLQPVPAGVQGELYLGGAGLARGYLNRPELTAEKFIPNPFSDAPGSCLYKTGDLARYLPDGNVEFLGRADYQVKIRGFRIELGGIESTLTRHPGVREAVVIDHEDAPGSKRLAAYVIAGGESVPTSQELRIFLKEKLPEYMVPASFIILDSLPLTPNGKVDRKALPAPEKSHGEGVFVEPRTQTEELLAGVWSEVLNVRQIGVFDNFFDLGGHSLLATQVVSRVREVFQVELPLRSLFEAQTVAELAERIETITHTEQLISVPPPTPVSRDRALPLSFAQQRIWFLDQLVPDSPLYNIPVTLRFRGLLNLQALEKSFNVIVRRHEALRTTFRMIEGNPVQVIMQEQYKPLPLIDLSSMPEPERRKEATRLMRMESGKSFDLANGPLIRAVLVRLTDQEHLLLSTMHHIVSDAWSMGVLVRELTKLYNAFSNGRPSPLTDLPIQYADFAVWQREWLQGKILDRQLSYWKDRLVGELPVLELPADRPRPPVQTFRGATYSFMLPAELSAKIKELSRREGVTLFMTLLAAFQTLLSRYTGQEDIIVGSPIANRNRSEIESLIGFFVNALALRIDLTGNPEFTELLARVKEITVASYDHQDLPFEMLVEELQPERKMSHSPIFQVMFALENAPTGMLELPGLTVNPLPIESSTSRYDLALVIEETTQVLSAFIEYSTDLFDESTIHRMALHFETLLRSIVADPAQRLSDLSLLTEAERQQLLIDWTASETPYPKDKCIHQLFEEQAEKTPKAVAAIFEERQLTYHELNKRANQLARYLTKKGVGRDSTVALMVNRSPEMIISLLGILKAGGTYLPIDPQNPTSRILSILDDSATNIVLTHGAAVGTIAFSKLKNLHDAAERIIVTNPREQITDLDALPFPDRTLVNYRKYDKYIGEGCVKRSISIMASRGCPYGCLYCHKIWPKRNIVRSADNIFKEVLLHYERGYRTFSILDDIFNLNRANSEAFFKLIIKNRLNIRILFPSGLRGDLLTSDYIDLMSEAGVMQMALALETASPRLQKLINKNINIQKLRDNLVYICNKHPHIIIDLFTMFGFPTETENEALMTLGFIKSIRWLHFPLLNALKIFPNTDMARFAMQHGVVKETIERSADRAYHEVSATMPFPTGFAREYQANFMKDYFLNRERLEKVIPVQKRILSYEEISAKYNSYLPGGLASYPEITELLGNDGFFSEDALPVQEREALPLPLLTLPQNEAENSKSSSKTGLRVLLVDLSQHFSNEADLLGSVVEAPLGLMYLLTYLNREFGNKVHGKIIKAMIDFDNFEELQSLIKEFNPQVIGLRTLSLYKNFFHKTVSLVKQWCPDVPLITGGPYGTSEYTTILSDSSIDLVVLGEGEMTFAEVIGKIIDNGGILPEDAILKGIPGLAFIPRQRAVAAETVSKSRDILFLDEIADEIAREDTSNPENVNTADDLAYVIYTSGSTGIPKGTAIPHRGVVRLVKETNYVNLGSDEVILQFAPISFDASTFEVWGSLLNGARLVLFPKEMPSLKELGQAIRDHQITTVWLTAGMFHLMVDEQLEDLKQLRQLLAGGDVLSVPHVRKALRELKGCRLINGYGPTEGTTFTCCNTISDPDRIASSVSIGRPISNTQVYLLDSYLNPVPVGVPGELHIGGAGLARAYLNRPDMTAERFIPNPFGDEPGSHLYKTGDIARWLPDGDIEYLGRMDHQVKIRGFRIELAEIEATLMQHAGVRDAVVIAREDSAGSKRLVAYIVPGYGQEVPPPAAELRDFLKEKLPDYMMPSQFIFLETLPLTPNGKVDRKVLPAPDGSQPELEGAYAAPRTLMEETLAAIWSDVLGIKRVGIYDNFFELGGDSILCIQLIARANDRGLKMAPRHVFQHQTIAELAGVTATMSPVHSEQETVSGPVLITPIQRWFFEQDIANRNHWNMAVLLIVREALDPVLLEQTVRQILLHHDALRLRYISGEAGLQQAISEPGEQIPFSCVDLSTVPEAEQTSAIEQTAAVLQASLDIFEGPLVRAALFHLGTRKAPRLLIVIHHLAVDGVSWRILLEDLQTVYGQLSRKEDIRLPLKTTSFKQWSERLTAYARSSELLREVDYWLTIPRRQVARLPIDYPDGANTVESGRTVEISLSEEETQALLKEVPKAYHTQINDVLLAAIAEAFSELTGERSLLIDLEGHGREDLFGDVDISRTVGWFSSMFPVHLELGDSSGPGEALRLIKEQLRRIPNRGIGYGLLRYLTRDTEVQEKLQALPQAEVSFNYLGQFDQVLSDASLLGLCEESCGPDQNMQGKRMHVLDVNGMIRGGRLRMTWTYSANIYARGTIERLADDFTKSLKSLILHCLLPDAGGYTPSDFPLAGLDQQTLEHLIGHDHRIEDIYPLTPLQQGLLFHTLYVHGSGEYFEQLRFTIRGEVKIPEFELAWQEVMGRYSILRTSFHWEELESPLQIVHREAELPWDRQDWRELSETEQDERLEAFLAEDKRRGFELSNAPLMRLALIRLTEQTYQCIWSHHHLLLDGWSVASLLKEILAFYDAKSNDRELHLARPRPYRDYISWLMQQDMTRAEGFWREKLKGISSPTPLGIDRKIEILPGQKDYDERHLLLSRSLTEELKNLVRGNQLTLNTLVQGAWALLLSRYSSEEDVVFGAVVSGRPGDLAGVESMVGLFINTLPVRVRISPEAPLLSWLEKIQNRHVELRQYEYSPLVMVQGWSDVPRGMPLFESIVVFENYPVDRSLKGQESGEGLEIRDVHVSERTNYPLSLIAVPGEELLLKVMYDCTRFDAPSIGRMLGHLRTVLEGMATDPGQRVSELPLLTGEERNQLLEWNKTEAVYSKDSCIHELFEEQVEKTPDAVALVFEDQTLTYRELNSRSNQLAHYLQKLGVGPDVLVGLCVERSLEMVVGLLGILKAGGAYVPLDPAYPKERIGFMLEDAGVSVLLTQEKLIDALSAHRAKLVCLDTEWGAITRKSRKNPAKRAASADVAYVIYTSGSTGTPKGVLVRHENVARLFSATDAWFHFNQQDVWTLFHSYAFDFSVWELWGALLYGGRLVVVPYLTSRSPEAFYELLFRERVTVLNQTPSAFRQLIHAEELSGKDNELSLRLVIFGGEALELQNLRPWFERHGDQSPRLVNMYGITETTVHVTYRPLTIADLNSTGSVIGAPIPDLQVYILDGHLQPLPIGVAGEMYIGGAGLSAGYLNRPELTRERFIANPFSSEPGSRLYKTGDLARRLPDGDIEYLGRIDHQVKIRGFRIELGEIEAALMKHAGVRETVVIAREDTPGVKRLAAYIVPLAGFAPEISELRAFLLQTLPDYMVPASFVFLESLPLTPNGKADRKALPAPDGSRPELYKAYAAPGTAIEETLSVIWAQVLGIERVGIHDNFFELGGDSILSIQIIARANEAGLKLTPKQIFQHQTIAELAAVADTAPAVQAEQDIVIGPVPLTPIQHWFFNQDIAERHHWNQAMLLEVREALDPVQLEQTIRQLLLHHDALRLRYIAGERGWQQTMSEPGKSVPVTHIDLRGISEAEQSRAVEKSATELQASLNLSDGPLMRVAWFDAGASRTGRLLIVIHHLAIDGVSWRILLEDLQTVYQQVSRKEDIRLPRKTTSFKQWSERLTGYAQSNELQRERAYWLRRESNVSPLPMDYPGGANTVASARTVAIFLSEEETQALLQEVPKAYHTQINDVLLTALTEAFSCWTKESSVLIDLEGHGREDLLNDLDLSRTVGWFTSLFPVNLELGEASGPGESLKRIKEHLRGIPNRGIGYGLLRYRNNDAELREKLEALPQAEVSFNYLGQFDQVLSDSSMFGLARESAGPSESVRGKRGHVLDINGMIAGGRLEMMWTYSENIHSHSTIERLANEFAKSLKRLIEHCLSPDAGGYTPSDFPASEISQNDLEKLIEKIF